MREKIGNLSKQMKGILDTAEANGRENLTDSERKKFDQLNDEVEKIKNKIADHQREMKNRNLQEFGRAPAGQIDPSPNGGTHGNNADLEGLETWQSLSGPSEGKDVKVLSNNRSVKDDLHIQDGGQDWRSYMRRRIQGHTGDTRDMDTTADSSLVPEPLSADVIDLARNKARIFQAGARTIPMSSKTLTIAKVTGDSQPEWKSENSAMTSSDVTTAPLTFTAHTLAANVKMSVELSEDAPNGAQVIRNSLAESLALELDRVGLVGSGTDPEPRGVFNANGVQVVDMGTDGSALSDYTPYSEAYQKVLQENGIPASVIHAPRTFGSLDRLTASDGQPLMAPQSYQSLQKFITSQVPTDLTKGTSGNASIAILGDYRQLMVGVRTNLRIEVTRVAGDAEGNAWENLQVWIRAYLRADIQLAHPEHFTVIDGIIPA